MADSGEDKRKHPRFRSTAFLGTPLILKAEPPLPTEPIEGQVVDLSGGGMAILIRDVLPTEAKMRMELFFPNKVLLACHVIVRRVSRCTGGHLIGIEFLDMSETMMKKIDAMAIDCNACDARIEEKEEIEICQPECTFMSICDKVQKVPGLGTQDIPIEMRLEQL